MGWGGANLYKLLFLYLYMGKQELSLWLLKTMYQSKVIQICSKRVRSSDIGISGAVIPMMRKLK